MPHKGLNGQYQLQTISGMQYDDYSKDLQSTARVLAAMAAKANANIAQQSDCIVVNNHVVVAETSGIGRHETPPKRYLGWTVTLRPISGCAQ